jgi:hypothetical protein
MTAQPETMPPSTEIDEPVSAEMLEFHVDSVLDALDNRRRAAMELNGAIERALPHLSGVNAGDIENPDLRAGLIKVLDTIRGNGGV